MELRACEYCNNDFEPKRKDHRYCTDSCRSKAYLDRKAAGIGNTPNNHNVKNSGFRKPHSRHSLNDSQLSTLISGQKANGLVLQGLLDEKDNSGDLKSENAKLEIKQIFLQRDLDQSEKDLNDARQTIRDLQEKLGRNEKSKLDKIFDSISEDPSQLPIIVQSCSTLLHSIKNGGQTPGIQGVTPSRENDLQIPVPFPAAPDNLQNQLTQKITEAFMLMPGADPLRLIEYIKNHLIENKDTIFEQTKT